MDIEPCAVLCGDKEAMQIMCADQHDGKTCPKEHSVPQGRTSTAKSSQNPEIELVQ